MTSLVESHAVWVPSTLGAQLLRGPGCDHVGASSTVWPLLKKKHPERTLSPLCSAFLPLHWAPRHWWLLCAWQTPRAEGTLGILLGWGGWGKLRWAGSHQSLPRCEHIRRGTHRSFSDPGQRFSRKALASSCPDLTLWTHLPSQFSSYLVHPSFLYVVCLGCNLI